MNSAIVTTKSECARDVGLCLVRSCCWNLADVAGPEACGSRCGRGLDTAAEQAAALGITIKRLDNIASKALLKLRRSRRAAPLREFL